jgi:16S rRNA (adenine1518-N6/adenine1519-N6)-dimethyltransferase
MTSAPALLKKYGLSAKKTHGQNFLVDRHAIERIVEAATPEPGGTVLEIGPGLGALTVQLLQRAARVVAVDKDPQMIDVLARELGASVDEGRLHLECADATSIDWRARLSAGPAPHCIVGNLPYLVTGRFLERAVEQADALPRVVFMVQREVADRLLAAPGTKDYGALTVFVQAAFEPSRVLHVKAGGFFPVPNVDSTVVLLERSRTPVPETTLFRALVKLAFAQRRKTLRNAWQGLEAPRDLVADASARAGIDLGRRGETLALLDFTRMERELEALVRELQDRR